MKNKRKILNLLDNMAVFNEVAKIGSFSGAGESLQMTPSAISKKVTTLEEALGVKLVERTTRSMRLTPTGEKLLTHCDNMLSEANLVAELATHSVEKLAGNISISAPKAYANQVLEPIILEFLKTYPDINVQVIVTDDIVNLLTDNIDCAVEISPQPSDFVIAKPLQSVKQILCATNEYLQDTPHIEHPRDLLNHSCLYLGEREDDNQWRFSKKNTLSESNLISDYTGKHQLHQNLSSKNITAKNTIKHHQNDEPQTYKVTVSGRYTVNHSRMRLVGILNHLGIGSLPEFVANEHIANGSVMQVLPDWELQSKFQGTAWLIYLPNKYQPLIIRTFIDYIIQHIQANQ